jgi:hypothetical protein
MPIYHVREARLGAQQVREWRRRAAGTVVLLVGNLVLCAIGLLLLDESGQSLGVKTFDAVWNATNLISTIGDFLPLSRAQRVFVTGTMFAFLIIGGFAISRLSGILSSAPAVAYRENRRMQGQLDKLANHVVVIGFGPLGQLVAGRLRDGGDAVVVVERDTELAARASEAGFLVVEADAGVEDGALKRVAGLDRAKALVVTTEEPDRKLAITLMAHALNPNLRIIVTGANSQRGALLRRAGAAEVVIAEDLIAEALVGRLAKQASG